MTEELYNKCYNVFADRYLYIIGILRASIDGNMIRMADDSHCMIIDKNNL
jgi:hypothetical protein